MKAMKTPEIIVSGKPNGEGMVVRYQTMRGTDIFGLGIPNIYLNADWDLEIIQFHIDRCCDILRIIDSQPKGLDEIAFEHFSALSLAGAGKLMARDEVMAHVEVMEKCGDVCWVGENRDRAQGSGSNNFIEVIGAYLQE